MDQPRRRSKARETKQQLTYNIEKLYLNPERQKQKDSAVHVLAKVTDLIEERRRRRRTQRCGTITTGIRVQTMTRELTS